MTPNKFAGKCCKCGQYVGPFKGIVKKENRSGPWLTQHAGECPVAAPAVNPFANLRPDEYQQAVIDGFMDVSSNLLVKARAGSGKTTIQCFALSELKKRHPTRRIACFAFGKEDGKRMQERLPSSIEARTLHSLGNHIINSNSKSAEYNQNKDKELVELAVGPDQHYRKQRRYVEETIEKCKADAVQPGDTAAIQATIKSYCLDIPEAELDNVVKKADMVLEMGLQTSKYGYNYNDMLWLPAIKNWKMPAYDDMGIDEAQDLSEAQLVMIRKCQERGARLFGVGDPNQSLYMFRGARADSFDRVRALLAAGGSLKDLPMPVCRRSGTAILALAQSLVPDIQAMPGAIKGETEFDFPIEQLLFDSQPGDMLICRTNAPLVEFAWKFISMDKQFYMRGGKQEAGMMVWLVNLFSDGGEFPKTNKVSTVLDRATAWVEAKAATGNKYRLLEWQSRVDVIKLISATAKDVEDLIKSIWRIFKEPADVSKCVVLSTIHRAKGSEAKRVWHIRPELCPHALAETEEEQAQELNAKYVGFTRAMNFYGETTGELMAAAA